MNFLKLASWVTLEFFPYAGFIFIIFRKNLRVSNYLAVGIIAACYIALLSLSYHTIGMRIPEGNWKMFLSLISTVFLIGFVYLFINQSLVKITFTYFMIISFDDNCRHLGKLIYGLTTGKEANYQNMAYFGICAVLFIASWIFLGYLMKRFIYPLINDDRNNALWRYIWMIPALFYVIFHSSISSDFIKLSVQYDISALISGVAWALGNCVTYCVVFKMLEELSSSILLQNKLYIADLELSMQKEQHRLLQQNIDNVRSAQHNLHHILISMKKYLEDKNYEELSHYIDGYLDRAVSDQGIQVCENYAVDSICQYYISVARKKGIQVATALNISEEIGVHEVDLCVIFGNLMENAVEACSRMKQGESFIDVRADLNKQGTLIIVMKNSYNGQVRLLKDIFLSAKREGAGVGLSSVKDIVNQYGGIFKVDYTDYLFKASIMIQLPDSGKEQEIKKTFSK